LHADTAGRCAAYSDALATSAGLRESHIHDVAITRESPNYPTAN